MKNYQNLSRQQGREEERKIAYAKTKEREKFPMQKPERERERTT